MAPNVHVTTHRACERDVILSNKYDWLSNRLLAFRSLGEVCDVNNDVSMTLTAPNATDSIVCSLSAASEDSSPSGFVRTPRLPINCPPAIFQNITCFTPHVTNFTSESGRNSAIKILWVCPLALASFSPGKENSCEAVNKECRQKIGRDQRRY